MLYMAFTRVHSFQYYFLPGEKEPMILTLVQRRPWIPFQLQQTEIIKIRYLLRGGFSKFMYNPQSNLGSSVFCCDLERLLFLRLHVVPVLEGFDLSDISSGNGSTAYLSIK